MSDHDDDEFLLGGARPEAAPVTLEADDDAAAPEADADALAAALGDSDSGSSSDDDDDDAAGAANGENAAGGGAANGDAAEAAAAGGEIDLSAIKSKKEAKALLSKKQYKKWKKKHGKKAKKDKKSKKSKKDDAKAKKGKKESSKKSKKSKKGGDDSDADDDDDAAARRGKRSTRQTRARRVADDANGEYDFEGGAMPPGMADTQRGAGLQQAKMTAKRKLAQVKEDCERVVRKMAEARKADAEAIRAGTPPLNRVRLIPLVRAAANRIDMHEWLVEAGFLQELGNWMCTGRQLAPIDLRSTALDALSLIKIEHAEGGKEIKQKKNKNGDVDDLDRYEGVSKEQLKGSNLGYAANFLRQHPSETTENRNKASYLLQRMSRAFAGEEPEVDPSTVKRWTAQGDATVLPPFEALQSSSELFVAKTVRVDPLDPTSYLRVPPLRLAKTYVSGVFNYAYDGTAEKRAGGAGARRHRVDHDDDDDDA